MESVPLFVLRPKRNPRIGSLIKLALCVTALVVAFMAVVLPHLLSSQDNLITGTLLFVAFCDLGLAFFLPQVIEKQMAETQFRFFRERLDINFNGKGYTLPYENIKSIEDRSSASDRAAGFANIRIMTITPLRVPLMGKGNLLILSSLPPEGDPLGKIKEVVENSRRK